MDAFGLGVLFNGIASIVLAFILFQDNITGSQESVKAIGILGIAALFTTIFLALLFAIPALVWSSINALLFSNFKSFKDNKIIFTLLSLLVISFVLCLFGFFSVISVGESLLQYSYIVGWFILVNIIISTAINFILFYKNKKKISKQASTLS